MLAQKKDDCKTKEAVADRKVNPKGKPEHLVY